MPFSRKVYEPHLDYHLNTEGWRINELSKFNSLDPDTLTPSIKFQQASLDAPLMDHIFETGRFPSHKSFPMISLIKRDEEEELFLTGDSGVSLFYTNELVLVKEILFILQFGYASRNQAQGGIFSLITNVQDRVGEAFNFAETDVMVRGDLALTYITPQALRRLLAEFAPYIAMTAYFESWIEVYLFQTKVGTIFQRFISEVNEILIGARAFITALEIQLTKGASFTLLELRRKCRLQFDTLDRVHKVFMSFPPDEMQSLLVEGQNASATGLLLGQLYSSLDQCWKGGDDHGYHVNLMLFKPCFEVYLELISSWIRFGRFQDFRNEFMVMEQEDGFQLRMDIPEFLKSLSEQILETGILLRELQSLQIQYCPNSDLHAESLSAAAAIAGFFSSFAPLAKRSRSPTFSMYDSPDYPIEKSNFTLPVFPDLPRMPPPRREGTFGAPSEGDGILERIVLAHLPHKKSNMEILPGTKHLFRGRSRFGLDGTIPHLVSFSHSFLQKLTDFVQERHVGYNVRILRHLRVQSGLMSVFVSLQAVFLFQHVPHMHIFTKELCHMRIKEPISQYHIDMLYSKALHHQSKQIPALPDIGLLSNQKYFLRTDCFSLVLSEDPIYPVAVNFFLPWPLDLAVDPSTLPIYQQIFSIIHRLQRARYALEKTGCWRADSARPTSSLWVAARLHLFYIINTIYSHIMTTILHSSSALFNREAESIKTLHELRARHSSFVHEIAQQCFIGVNFRPFLTSVFDIIALVDELNIPDPTLLKDDILDRISYLQNFLTSTLSSLSRSATFSRVEALAFALEK